MRLYPITRYLHYAVVAIFVTLWILALPEYKGSVWVFTVFSVLSGALLYAAFRKNALFFDAFIGVFFLLGFWLKLIIKIAFYNSVMGEPVGNFDGTGEAFDRALLVASCGFGGLLAASFTREKLGFKYASEISPEDNSPLSLFYKRYRWLLLSAFVLIIVAVGVSNAYLGIYQKGSITRTTLPFGLNGVYKWLLLFGLAAVSALLIKFEMARSRNSLPWVLLLGFFESFISNVSQLSRGMILNSSALLYGSWVTALKLKVRIRWRTACALMAAFSILFVVSVLSVNYIRSHLYLDEETSLSGEKFDVVKETQSKTKKLFIDRWVGLEGVMAVSSYPDLGWGIWTAAWQERYNENETSLYDNNFIESSYLNTDKSKHHFISLPGAIAFFFYPGSFTFLFLSMFALGLFAAFAEFFAFKMGGKNLILCALIGQVVAYRYVSFGYVPQQSYLLFGTIFATPLIIYLGNKYLAFCGVNSSTSMNKKFS
jgi:hypothetical protein